MVTSKAESTRINHTHSLVVPVAAVLITRTFPISADTIAHVCIAVDKRAMSVSPSAATEQEA